MAIDKGKIDAGQGGRLGHSNMAHWVYSHELKESSRKARRLEAKRQVRAGLAEQAAADEAPMKKPARKPAPRKAAPKTDTARVRAYLAALPAGARRALAHMRNAIHTAVRKGDDAISYGIPCVKRDGKVVVWYAAWKTHVSIYPIGPAIVSQLGSALDGCECSKGTVRFPIDKPPSAPLVRRIVKARLKAMGPPVTRRGGA